MALDLSRQRERLLTEERRRHDEEVEHQLLAAEYRRKSRELEEARQFQLSLLPKELPRHPTFEVAVHMQTANEVGGDYYDFHLAENGTLTAAVGDATGHGARAGTMVTAVKSLFSAYASGAGLCRFLINANRTVRRMDLGRMSMGLVLAELRHGTLTVSAAGMPPALICRCGSGEIEELAIEGMPLGGLEFAYREERRELLPGDTVLLMSDGLPELLDPGGEPLGYAEVRRIFAAAAPRPPAEIVAELAAAVAGVYPRRASQRRRDLRRRQGRRDRLNAAWRATKSATARDSARQRRSKPTCCEDLFGAGTPPAGGERVAQGLSSLGEGQAHQADEGRKLRNRHR